MSQIKTFSKLIVNELYKSFFQKKTIAFLILLVVLTGALAYAGVQENSEGDWRKEAQTDITKLEKEIKQLSGEKRKNEELIARKNERITVLKYRLKEDIPEDVISTLSFIFICCNNISIVILLFMAVFSSEVIASEYSQGTIRQILVKPVKRWKIFVSKFISTFLVALVMFAFLLIVAALVGLIVFGDVSTSIYDVKWAQGEIVKFNMLTDLYLTILARIFALMVVTTITFFVATVTRKSALAIIVSFVMLFGGAAIFREYISKYDFYKYVLFPNMMLDQYLPSGELPYEGATFNFSLAVCLAYAAVFFTAGLLTFQKRDIF
jgi:ABC-2 type transport system permease protein